MRKMITFDHEQARFSYRVVGVLVEDGYVLVHKNTGDDFWALPGGRGELLEPSDVTIKREFEEELDVQVQVERLLWSVENFFTWDGIDFHEISFYYLVSLPEPSALSDKQSLHKGVETDVDLVFCWLPVDELEEQKHGLYPVFLRKSLQNLPTVPQHVIHYD